MMRRRLLPIVVVAALACTTSTTAHADPTSKPSPTSLGWTVLVLSVAAGASLTGVSMAVDCKDDLECARWTSLGIWGGIGIASAGAAAGLILVEAASRPRVQVSFTVDRSQSGPSMPRATLVYVF